MSSFNNKEIFFIEELTYKLSGIRYPLTGCMYRRKDGIDYIKTKINLNYRIKIDQRCEKLKFISNL